MENPAFRNPPESKSETETETEREHMFDIVLTSLDIGGQLHIPENHGEKHFPELSSDFRLSDSCSTNKPSSISLSFLDPQGKLWPFKYVRFQGNVFAFTEGWADYVRENGLVAGDTVSFWHVPGKQPDSEDLLYIVYKTRLPQRLCSNLILQEDSDTGNQKSSTTSSDPAEESISTSAQSGQVCLFKGCTDGTLGSSGFCKVHGADGELYAVSKSTLAPTFQKHNCRSRCMYKLKGGTCDKPCVDDSSDYCFAHGARKRCAFVDCTRYARAGTEFCFAHGRKRCAFIRCTKSVASSRSKFCIAHIGGREDCASPGCTKLASDRSIFCIAHIGGEKCASPGCTRLARGRSKFCIAHIGGGEKCASPGCHKRARGPSGFCIGHGDKKLCKFENCGKLATAYTDLCKEHGGGNRHCSWEGEEKCPNFAMSEFCSIHNSKVDDKETDPKQGIEPSVAITVVGDNSTDNEAYLAMLYCALFPEDYEFPKDMLVHLWIAGRLFKEELFECTAGRHFEKFLFFGYIQFSKTDLVSGKPMYKFDRKNVSDFLSGSSHALIGNRDSNLIDDLPKDISHVSVRCCKQIDSKAIGSFKSLKHLETLLFLEGHKSSFKQVPRGLFLSLELLQALDLSRTHISVLPNSVANMKQLRYLDLSHTSIRRLPETMDQLNNLQTLKLKGCSKFSMLPKGMKKLVNLRHLDLNILHQLRSMPKGMGALTNLQTLSAFLVDREDECGIKQLENMNNLKGSFCISRLENVHTKEEASKACLYNKSQLMKLEFRWSDSRDEDSVNIDDKILCSLRPNTNLEELRVVHYGGSELPSWIFDPAFSKLVSIILFKCEHCLALPSLGQLPSLKILNIVEFDKLMVIDHNSNGGIGIQGCMAFPKLEKLSIENMFSLEEWTGIGNSTFPRLLKLSIKNCPKLLRVCTLSRVHLLESLEVSHCPMLESCTDGTLPASVETFIIEDCALISAKLLSSGSNDWLKLTHVPNVWVDHQQMPFGERSMHSC